MTVNPKDHPAKFSAPVLAAIAEDLREHLAPVTLNRSAPRILDPFAGVGGIHKLWPEYETVGIELEPEWAATHPSTIVGDARYLPFDDDDFDAVVTSPCYGNRMADQYAGESICPKCHGLGRVFGEHKDAPVPVDLCPRCEGAGQIKPTKRYTYRLALGRALTLGSAAVMQWGDAYRNFHATAWAEAHRVTRPGGLLIVNISDHIRDDEPQGVDLWHAATVAGLGYSLLSTTPVRTRRNGNGANRDQRATREWVLTFRKPL